VLGPQPLPQRPGCYPISVALRTSSATRAALTAMAAADPSLGSWLRFLEATGPTNLWAARNSVRRETDSTLRSKGDDRAGCDFSQAVAVVVSTVGIYVTLVVLLRIFGQRALANMSSFDFAAAIALGAVTGRVVLGYTPTLLAGVIGLGTLFVLQVVFSLARRHRRVDAALSNLPVLLMAKGRVLPAGLRNAHIVEDELRAKLRTAGVRSYDDVACVILERTGTVSVLRRGESISPELLQDVRGREVLEHTD
jgi:uncharacterized membrane protein YcaP (DUF421 family)